jgi:co-chaperonin GroES (HSP10)
MIKPVGHRILIEVDEAELEAEWEIDGQKVEFQIVSDKKLENAAVTSGKLVAAGEQAWKAFGPEFTGEPWAKVGDQVFFARYAGNVIEDPTDGKNYKIMNDEDIVAVVGTDNG